MATETYFQMFDRVARYHCGGTHAPACTAPEGMPLSEAHTHTHLYHPWEIDQAECDNDGCDFVEPPEED